ncbi:MAG: CpsB/CapC family capsule biosynthesis tyrosine phosphatase [Chitinophagales bacterium]
MPKQDRPGAHVLHTDMHMHILPGLDDGAVRMEESVMLVKALSALGYKKCICTPHIQTSVYLNTPENIYAACSALRSVLDAEQIEMEIQGAAEYYIDDDFADQHPGFTGLLTLRENWILVETGLHVRSAAFDRTLFDMQLAGFQPVLAHPERYAWMFEKQDLSVAAQYREAGIIFQTNIMSFSGLYGEGPKKYARKLADAGYIDLLGTDLHNARQLPFLENALRDKYVLKLIRSQLLKNAKL